ncbi:hypothetical protein [Burkholderia sp. Ax-1724]|uniref:hypothetical protein n=1 Tax=Burkholderia sp. Ax-1724 TaxID=2608336 RepID=UPI00141DE1E0|nr:hypothetical protein [Burkholderia sp. Ax-1724]NIF51632.1 hypothetical protein [Burkholderia sp. Ax-1724]
MSAVFLVFLFMSIPTLQAQTILPSATGSDLQDIPKPMSAREQEQLLRFTEIGLQWIAGQITFDDVTRHLGKPQYQSEQIDLVKYAYYQEGVMSIYFIYNKLKLVDGKPGIDSFSIKISDDIHTNIPYERFESLGLHRLVRGESIDGVRIEQGDFFVPVEVADASRFYPENFFGFNYRLPMPPDSLFDVYVGLGYLGEWRDQGGGEAKLSKVRKAVDLRNLGISRHYLTPEELEQRHLAKRQKYGMMDLRTGMVCPETGLWESWTQAGIVGKAVVRAGDRFKPHLRLDMPPAEVRWMWSGEYRPERLA